MVSAVLIILPDNQYSKESIVSVLLLEACGRALLCSPGVKQQSRQGSQP